MSEKMHYFKTRQVATMESENAHIDFQLYACVSFLCVSSAQRSVFICMKAKMYDFRTRQGLTRVVCMQRCLYE